MDIMIRLGSGQVVVPPDVFETLKREKVIFEKKPDRWLFVYQWEDQKSYIQFSEGEEDTITIKRDA